MQVFAELEPPSKTPSRYEKHVITNLRAKRGVWHLVHISRQPFLTPSFLADHNNVETEAGLRKREELEEVIGFVAHQTGKQPEDFDNGHWYCLWARYVTNSRTKKAMSSPSVSSDKRYSPAVIRLSKRLHEQAREYNPESLSVDHSESRDWLKPMSEMVHTEQGGAEGIDAILDFIFGKEDRSTLPDNFWSTAIASPGSMSRNLAKIKDAKLKNKIRSDRIVQQQQQPQRKQETRQFGKKLKNNGTDRS